MSSYDERNAAQIRLDEMIKKYEMRSTEAKWAATRCKDDEELSKQLALLCADLLYLKTLQDAAFKKNKRVVK
jgi:hypothetical protein